MTLIPGIVFAQGANIPVSYDVPASNDRAYDQNEQHIRSFGPTNAAYIERANAQSPQVKPGPSHRIPPRQPIETQSSIRTPLPEADLPNYPPQERRNFGTHDAQVLAPNATPNAVPLRFIQNSPQNPSHAQHYQGDTPPVGQHHPAFSQRPAGSNIPTERKLPSQTENSRQPQTRQVKFQNLEDAGELHDLPPIKKAPQPPKERVSGNYTLQNLGAAEFEKKMLEKLGERCVPVTNVETKPDQKRFQMPTADGSALDLTISRQNGTLNISGSKASVAAFGQIAKLLDTREKNSNLQTELLPYHGVNYRAVRQTATVIEESQNPNNQPLPAPRNQQSGAAIVPPTDGSRSAPLPGTTNEVLGQMAQVGLVGPVQVEVIEGLDIVVIKGNRQDVALVKEMINQIEKTGAEQEPEIVIHLMQNTDCTRIGTIVRLLYNEIYGTRRGSINITALVKPNALLLVGRKESIETAIELIKKLDIPVDPQSEFRVVRLKHAASATVKTMLDEFYANREQMGPQIRVTSDSRTNSLIVQANPRDIEEVLAMIQKIDAAESEAINTLQIFNLLNTNASELASVIQNAVTGLGTTSGTGGFSQAAGASSQQTAGTRSTMLEFRTLDAREGEVLRSGIIASNIRVTADTRSNSLIVNAPADTMPLVAALIQQLDQLPVAESQVKVFMIINGDATSLYNMLQTLFQTQTSGTSNTNTALTTRPGFSEGESAMIPVRFAVDVRTNSIVATGSAGDLTVVEAILLRLDEGETQNRTVSVFRLLNSPVTQIAQAINNYLTNERSVERIDTELFSVYEQFRREVVVIPEIVTNSLIVSCTPRFYNDIRRIIKELDDRPPMVVIQVLIAEVTLKNMNEFGVEFGLQDSILFDRSVFKNGDTLPTTVSLPNGTVVYAGPSGSGTDAVSAGPGFNFNDIVNPLGNNAGLTNTGTVGTQGLTNLGVGRSNSTGGGGFVFSASSESVSVLIRALEERQNVNVLSRPQVTALDNERATIQVGQEIQILTSASMTNYGMVSDTEYKPLGLILDITPRINTDGLVVMSIYTEKSFAGPDAEGTTIATGVDGTPIKSPRINISKVQTTVSAMDGQTIVLGGLITNEVTKTTRAVPFISKIPVVGRLFEYNSQSCDRKEMLIIMTPTIIRSEEDAERVKMQEIQRIHWCVNDVMSISVAKNIRVRGDYYSPNESEVIYYDGYVPSDEELLKNGQTLLDQPYIPGTPTGIKPELLEENKKAPKPAPPRSNPELIPRNTTPQPQPGGNGMQTAVTYGQPVQR